MVRLTRPKLRDQRGFTLIELMIVVVVIAILAIVVVPTFFRESTKTKSISEVGPMFAEMGIKLEQYRSENAQYLAAAACPAGALPPTAKYAATACSTVWDPLRIASPAAQLKCQYTIVVGAVGATAGTVLGGFAFTAPTTQPWYYIYATCNGDNQAGTNAEFFASSLDPTIMKKNESQ